MQNNRGWEKISKWYDNDTTIKGSFLHNELVIPYLKNTMKLNSRDTVLDVGCGNGFLYNYIKKYTSNYYGIDISSSLIDSAKRYHNIKNFYVDDISEKLKDTIKNKKFTKIFFILSIQDIKFLEPTVRNIRNLTEPGAEVFIFMLHPAFKIPRQSGFVYDESRKMLSRRIDSYLSFNDIPFKKNEKDVYVANFYHRPIFYYINTWANESFYLTSMFEIVRNHKNHEFKKTENRIMKEIPSFIILKLKRF